MKNVTKSLFVCAFTLAAGLASRAAVADRLDSNPWLEQGQPSCEFLVYKPNGKLVGGYSSMQYAVSAEKCLEYVYLNPHLLPEGGTIEIKFQVPLSEIKALRDAIDARAKGAAKSDRNRTAPTENESSGISAQ